MFVPYNLMVPDGDGEAAHLYLFGDIMEGSWLEPGDESPQNLAMELKEMPAKELIVHIDSYGGVLSAGITIYNLLRNLEADVTTIVEGFACSAASLIFLGGKHRIMRESSLLMIHNAWSYAEGNAEELRKTADDLEKISSVAAGIYKQYASIDGDQIDALLASESWITPQEALDYGFATAVERDETAGNGPLASAFSVIRNALIRDEPEPFGGIFRAFNR